MNSGPPPWHLQFARVRFRIRKWSAASYRALGDDPFVVPVDGAAMIEFSAWDYAEERCRAICGLTLHE
jgi:hypothetical protein